MEPIPTVEIDGEQWPEWVTVTPVREMTPAEFEALPEYSTTQPDSYKRPLADGGRPWKRNVNVSGRFGMGCRWLYCEYRPENDPAFPGYLVTYSQRIVLI